MNLSPYHVPCQQLKKLNELKLNENVKFLALEKPSLLLDMLWVAENNRVHLRDAKLEK